MFVLVCFSCEQPYNTTRLTSHWFVYLRHHHLMNGSSGFMLEIVVSTGRVESFHTLTHVRTTQQLMMNQVCVSKPACVHSCACLHACAARAHQLRCAAALAHSGFAKSVPPKVPPSCIGSSDVVLGLTVYENGLGLASAWTLERSPCKYGRVYRVARPFCIRSRPKYSAKGGAGRPS